MTGLELGSAVEPIWIKDLGDSGSHPVVTALRGRAMTSEMHTKLAAAMEKAEHLDGVVERLKHPYADIMVTLADGSAALGGLHVSNLGKGQVEDIQQHLSVGDKVHSRIALFLFSLAGLGKGSPGFFWAMDMESLELTHKPLGAAEFQERAGKWTTR